jgi:4-alpha-glucanotransferase
VLAELSIPGLEVMRWARDWGKTNDFLSTDKYRPNAVAVASTHDMTPVAAWWKQEAATVDDYFFQLKCAARRLDYETVAAKLFEPAVNGRRRWRAEIDTEEVFLWNLGIPAERAGDFLDLFRSTRFEREAYWRFLGLSGRVYPKPTPRFVQRVLEKANESASIFSVQLFQDWLATAGVIPKDLGSDRINLPGSIGAHNWSFVSPLSLEELVKWPGNRGILELNRRTGRA